MALMLLSLSTCFQDCVFGWADEVEHLADDLSLQASDDVALAEAFGGAPGSALDCGLMKAHSDDDDDGAIDRGVQLSVSAVVDAMAT